MWRHFAANALTFLIVGLFLVAGVVTWGVNQYRAEGPLDDPICVQVRSGSNFRLLSQQLEEQGAISSPAIFRMGADYTERTGALKAGSFLVPARASMDEITSIVTRGGASSCGTEVVYRIGVNRTLAQVRELDPATNQFEERAEFQPLVDDTLPPEYERVRAEPTPPTAWSCRRRHELAGAPSPQTPSDVLEATVTDIPPRHASPQQLRHRARPRGRPPSSTRCDPRRPAILAGGVAPAPTTSPSPRPRRP
jgi:hypothetical protein